MRTTYSVLLKYFMLAASIQPGLLSATDLPKPLETIPNSLIANTLEYPPYEYQENGEAKGIAVDIIREALKRAGVSEVQFNFYPWKRAVYLTENGQSDMLFNAGKNKARQTWGYYTDQVLIKQSYVLFKKRSKAINLKPDFSNAQQLKIAVRSGYLYGSGTFRKALDDQQFMLTTLSDSTEQSVNLLLRGRVDLFVGDKLPVMHYIHQQGLEDQIDVVLDRGQPLEVLSWPTYILFSKQRTTQEFVDKVSEAMRKMTAEGLTADITARYTQSDQ